MNNKTKSGPIKNRPVTAVIVGAGHRSLIYASYSVRNSDQLKIIGVAEPNDIRRKSTAEKYKIPPQNCFASAEELYNKPPIADVIINGTMDSDHVRTSVPLLEAGYHVLLEKPIATDEQQLLKLYKTVRMTGRKVLICHVMRYNPFYVEIKKRVLNGDVGEILNIQTAEHVSYHHASVSFIRDKWNNREKCGSTMLMQKCCHDLDMLTWLKSGYSPVKVSSMGGRMFFREDKAPDKSGTRCLVDCPIEEECIYSARKIYLDHPNRWKFYVWRFLEHIDNPTIEQKEESLKTDNPHGRCIWKCDNDVVDHQSVVIEFNDGSTATHNLVAGAARASRKIHILGTKGEILGNNEDRSFIIRRPDPSPCTAMDFADEKIKINTKNIETEQGGHLGDLLLVKDFVSIIRGRKPSISTTSIDDSIYGHLIGFRADKAMRENKTKDLKFDIET